jgi:hypothetical protein
MAAEAVAGAVAAVAAGISVPVGYDSLTRANS